VSNRFRDLEKPDFRRPDDVLMATIASFQDIAHPGRQQMRQFAELFGPLFDQVSGETRRTAVAALSRCRRVPDEIARIVSNQPIEVSAPFIVNSPAIGETILAQIVERGDTAQIRAIARRKALSGSIVAALAATGDGATLRSLKLRRLLPAEFDDAARNDAHRQRNEEMLRGQLRSLVDRKGAATPRRREHPVLPAATVGQINRLVAFAQQRQPLYFVTALADTLSSSFQLAEHIMLDISGRRLAETLLAIGLDVTLCASTLERFFPHLARRTDGIPASRTLLETLRPEEAASRVSAWLGADGLNRIGIRREPAIEDGTAKADRQELRSAREAGWQRPAAHRRLRRAGS